MPRFADAKTPKVGGKPMTPRLTETDEDPKAIGSNNMRSASPRLASVFSNVPELVSPGGSSIAPYANTADVNDIMKVLEAISFEIHTNLKFTKAIYRGTKKNLTGPGFEPKRLNSGIEHAISGTPKNSEANRQDAMDRQSTGRSVDRKRRSRLSDKSLPPTSDSPGYLASSPGAAVVADALAILSRRHEAELKKEQLESYESEHIASSSLSNPTVQIEDASDTVSGDGKYSDSKNGRTVQLGSTCSTITNMLAQHQTLQNKASVRMWRFMEDPNSSRSARVYYFARIWFWALSIIVACLQVFDDKLTLVTEMTYLQLGIELVFFLEVSARFCVASDRIAFLVAGFNIFDFLSIVPCVLRIYVLISNEDSREIQGLFGMVPVFRLLKLLRHFDTFQLLWNAFLSAAEALPMLIFTLFLIASTFASLIYYCEPRSSIPDMPLALYFAIVTVTTVGYGDFVAQTGYGRLWTCFLSVIGPMYMAIPIGIIGNAFSQVWEDRRRLLMLHRMRTYVKNVGYTRKDLKHMFELIDQNGDGTLDLEEFVSWLDVLEIRMPEDVVSQVFESFDADDEGTIDFTELLRGLFPRTKYGLTNFRDSMHSIKVSLTQARKASDASDKSEPLHG